MLYSRYAKKNKRLMKLQEDQKKEIDDAHGKRIKAQNHEEKLKIQAKSRSNLNKLAKDYQESGKKDPEAPKAPKAEKLIDLKNKKQVAAAVKKALKGK